MAWGMQVDEARDILAHVVLCHVPVHKYNFQQKVRPVTTLSKKNGT
jgi:DNA-directed RNA polymerase III subunit RPC2